MDKGNLNVKHEQEELAYGRSIPICRNDEGEYVAPANAMPRVWYKCYDPTCSAQFFKRVRNGNAHMVIRKGMFHTGKFCRGDTKRKTVCDMLKTVYGGLERAIMRLRPKRREEPDEEIDEVEGEFKIKFPKAPQNMLEYKRAMSSLRQLEKYGITKMSNAILVRGVQTVDVFVSRNNAHYVMEGRTDFGARGMEVTPEGAYDHEMRLRFLFRENRASKNTKFRKKILDMVFTSQEEYELARDKVFARNTVTEGRSPYVPRYRGTVYIYGIWRASSESACKAVCKKSCTTNNSVCTGHLESVGINADTQIYIPRQRVEN